MKPLEDARYCLGHTVAFDPATKRLTRLLDDLALAEIDRPGYDRIAELSQTMLEQLASSLVHLPDELSRHQQRLFRFVAEIRPEAFHPHLGQLARQRDPSASAYRNAAWRDVKPHAARLAELSGPAGDEQEFALRVLLNSGCPEAQQAIIRYLEREPEARDTVAALALEHGYLATDAGLVPLWNEPCAAVRAVESDPARSSVTMGGVSPGDGACSGCGQGLARIFYVQRSRLPWPRDGRNFAIDTCVACVPGQEWYFVHYPNRDNPASLAALGAKPKSGKSKGKGKAKDSATQDLAKRPCVLVEAPRERSRESDGPPGAFSRIGGLPTWQSAPRSVACPQCAKPMTFVAQTDELWGEGGALLLAFECLPCAVVATTREPR